MRRKPSEISHIAADCVEEASSFSGNLQGTTDFDGMPEEDRIPRSHVLLTTDILLQQLMTSPITSKNIVTLQKHLEELISYLPGPYTPQKFICLDVDPVWLSLFKKTHYKLILETVLDVVTSDCFDMQSFVNVVSKIFCIDGGGASMFYDSLSVLNRKLMECESHTKRLESIVNLLEKLIKSDAFETCLIELCKINNNNNNALKVPVNNYSIEEWFEMIQLMTSLPNRVANRLKNSTPVDFMPQRFCKTIVFHIAKVIKFIGTSKNKYDIDLNTDMLSILLSKFVVNYSDGGKSEIFNLLFKCLGYWSMDKEIALVINGVLLGLSRQAIVCCAPMILANVDDHSLLEHMLLDAVLKSEDWAYVMCTRIPLLSQNLDSHIAVNLAGYLVLLNGGKLLFNVVQELIEVWGSKISIVHTTLDQHISCTIMLLVAVAYLDFNSHDSVVLEQKLLTAVPAHLESSNEAIRVIGMFTAETVISYIFKGKEKPTLQFDYDGMAASVIKIIESFRKLLKVVESNKQKYHLKRTADSKISASVNAGCEFIEGDKILKQLEPEYCAVAPSKETMLTNSNYVTLDNVFMNEMSEKNIKSAPTSEINYKSGSDNDSILDSDDDLVQLDLSDAKSDKNSPLYIRDLKDFLLETEDPEIFQVCLENAESLILSQMLDEDISLGIELLGILISLSEKYVVENFEFLKINAAVAIVMTYPVPSAEFLGEQFNIKQGRYSVDQLLFILHVIERAAQKQSNIDMDIEFLKATQTNPLKQNVGKSRRFFSDRKNNPKSTINKFSSVCGSFFFPLIRGATIKALCNDVEDTVVLVQLLHCFATIMLCVSHGEVVLQMAMELFSLAGVLHKHPQCGVRFASLQCVGASVLSSSEVSLNFLETVSFTFNWLTEMSSNDPDARCRELASEVASLISSQRAHNILQLFDNTSIS